MCPWFFKQDFSRAWLILFSERVYIQYHHIFAETSSGNRLPDICNFWMAKYRSSVLSKYHFLTESLSLSMEG